MSFFTRFKPPTSPFLKCNMPSLTRQEFAREADINHILERYKETGYLTDPTRPPTRRPIFGDFSDVCDYQSALEAINQAQEAFMALPAVVRDRFRNDPQALLDFVSDPANQAEAVKLGLADPPADPPADSPADPPTDLPADPPADSK